MILKENGFFTLKLDNSFEWDLESFDLDTLFNLLLLQEKTIPLGGTEQEQPKSSLGFGLKKKSIGLEQKASSILKIDLPNPALTQELTQQYKEFYHLSSFDQPYVFILGLGSIKKDRHKSIVFCLPVELVLLSKKDEESEEEIQTVEYPFGLRWTGDLPFYNETAEVIINEFGKKLPPIPDVLNDISLSNLIHDLTYQLDEGTQLQFSTDIYFSRVKFEHVNDPESISTVQKENFTFFDNSFKHSQKIQTQSLQTLYATIKSEAQHIHVTVSDDEYAPFVHNLAFNKVQDSTVIVAFRSKLQLERFEQLYGKSNGIFSFHHLKVRQHFVSEALEKIEYLPKPIEQPDDFGLAEDALQRLDEYDTALNSPFYEGSWAPSEIMGKVLHSTFKCDYRPELFEIQYVTPVILNQRKQLLKQILKLEQQLKPHPILDDSQPELSNDELNEELTKIEIEYEETAKKILESKQEIQKITGIQVPEDEYKILALIERLEILEDAPPFDRTQIDINWYPIPAVVTKALDLLTNLRNLFKKDLTPYFHNEILSEPIKELLSVIEPLSNSPKRFIDWTYMQHTKRLLGYSKNPNQKFDYSFQKSVKDLITIQEKLNEFNEVSKQVSSYFGTYWQGFDSDIEFLTKQISWLEAFSKLSVDYKDQNIDELKKLINRKDTKRAITTVKALQTLIHQRSNSINRIGQLLQLRTLSIQNEIEKRQQSILEFIAEIKDALPYLKQKSMLNRLKDSDNARTFEPFLKFALKENYSINDVSDIYEFVILKATLDQIEADRPILKHVETSDLKILIEIVTDYYEELIEKSQSEFVNTLLENRQQPSSRKKIKDITNLLLRFTETNRIPHYVSLFKSVKDALAITHPIFLCSMEQLEYIYPALQQVSLITDFPVNTTYLKENTSNYIIQSEPTKKSYPPILYKRSVPKAKQKKGEQDTAVLREILKTKDILPILWVFNSVKAEQHFWNTITLEPNLVTDFSEASIKLSTITEDKLDSVSNRKFAAIVANYSYLETKVNPFALKKSSPKLLQEYAEKMSQLADYVYVISNEGEKNDDIKKRITFLESASKWTIHDESLLKTQLEKATFLSDTFVHAEPESLLNGYLRFKDKRLAYIWSDASQNQNQRLVETIINSSCLAYPIYNPIRKLYKKTDTLLFDALAFTKNEPPKRALNKDEKHQLKPAVSQEEIEILDEVLDHVDADLEKIVDEALSEKPNQKPIIKESKFATKSVQNKSETKEPTQPIDIFATVSIPSDFTFNKIESTDTKSIKPKLNKLPRIKFFMPHPVAILGTPEDFFKATARSIKKVILEIVKNETPIHWYRLTRLMAESWKMDSLNENMILITKKLLTELHQQQEVFVKQGVVYDNPSYNFTIRSRSGLTEFNSEEIPLVELEMALFLVLDQYYPISYEDLIKASSHLLGFTEYSSSMETVLKRALIKMGMEGIVSFTDAGFQLTRPTFM